MPMNLSLGLGLGSIPVNEGVGQSPAIYPIDEVGGTAPAFVYGTVKLVSAYSGPAFRLVRLADSVEQDIGFVGQRLDTAALAAFDPLGTGQILKWYDQSGNGNHTDTQATPASRCILSARTSPNGHHFAYAGAAAYELPAISWDNRATTIYTVIEGNFANNVNAGFIQLGNTQQIVNSGISDQTGNFVTGLRREGRVVITEMIASAASRLHNHGDKEATQAALSAGSASGGRIGNSNGSFPMRGHALAWIGYQRAFASDERATMKAALKLVAGVWDDPVGVFVAMGDSITRGTLGTAGNVGYATMAYTSLGSEVRYYNAARGGQALGPSGTSGTMLNLFASGVGALLDQYTSGPRVFSCMAGTNDVTSGRSAADIYSDYSTLISSVKAKGFKFLAITQTPNGNDNSTLRAVRADFNDLVRANSGGADAIWDAAAHPIMGDLEAPTPYYSDKLHPTNLGDTLLAPGLAAAVAALL